MSIHIKAKGIVERGVRKYEVEEVQALKKTELPEEYMEGYPRIHDTSQDSIRIEGTELSRFALIVGQVYTRIEMEERLEIIRAAGDRLREINTRLAKENEGWGGAHYWII